VILGNTKIERDRVSDPTTTLDVLFRRAAARRPDVIALADPPNRESFIHGAPHRLSYAEADRIVAAIAARLRKLGLQTDAVVGIHLPNTVECALTILGVLRAGLIAVPLPILWRRAEMAPVMGRLGAKAIVTANSVGGIASCSQAMQVAAENFSVRYVCGFGPNLPDGVISFNDLLTEQTGDWCGPERNHPAAHVAVVTVEIASDGPAMMARSHSQLIAGGLGALLEGGLCQDTRLLGCCAIGSFAGLALTLVPWLLTSGTLLLHHGFDAPAFAAQCRDDRCDTVVVPGPLLSRLAEARMLAHPDLKNLLAFWRAPEALAGSPTWQTANVALTDMLAFGEIALLGSRRGASGEPKPPPAGAIFAPQGAAGGALLAEMTRSATGTVALRGPMVPQHAFPPGAERGDTPHLKADAGGFVDTRYACRVDAGSGTFTVTGPPPGMVAVGGYRFALGELAKWVRRTDGDACVTALPDALAGHRLAGIAATEDVRAALATLGVNPLLVDAFDSRSKPAAA
jgi:hypothetical protein